MSYPPDIPDLERFDNTPLTENHPTEHNMVNQALTDVVVELGDAPKGEYPDVEARLNAMIPTGTIWFFGGGAAPSGWTLCDGQARNGEDPEFAPLFTVIGNAYGGTDATDFETPNAKGASFIGMNDVGGVGAALGEVGGQIDVKEHTHVQNKHKHANTANQDSHSHDAGTLETAGAGEHGHGIMDGVAAFVRVGAGGASSTYKPPQPGSAVLESNELHTVNDHFHGMVGETEAADPKITMANVDGTATNQNTGAGDNNMNPYVTVLAIIKL
ncbi:MAG: hypothetical protein DRJ50_14985 [Actinobacteria bacterium]|nr:MAG: hypothetical protein DRJ50_14985 [Actinomycetota bacterium]